MALDQSLQMVLNFDAMARLVCGAFGGLETSEHRTRSSGVENRRENRWEPQLQQTKQ